MDANEEAIWKNMITQMNRTCFECFKDIDVI